MADDQRVYSDEEFAVILRTAAELASRPDQPGVSSGSLTLAEMKSAAAQAGLDPVLVERAARLLVDRPTDSLVERVIGGPLRHEHTTRFSIRLDAESAARVLSAVRINAHFHGSDPGHSSALGMSWTAWGSGDALSVIARPDRDGTSVTLVLNRRSMFVLTSIFSSFALYFAVLFAVFGLMPEGAVPGFGGLVLGVGGVLALARGYWARSTRRAREQIGLMLDAIGQTLAQPEPEEGSATPLPDAKRTP